ncbi:MAG TPA: hypothetical protein VJQ61_04760, partial [Sinomonas sp.]|nr:hypothetical protein [Sinomonas sp.]
SLDGPLAEQLVRVECKEKEVKLHRAGSVGLVVAGVLGGAAFAAAPAHTDIYGCSTSTVCIYEHT